MFGQKSKRIRELEDRLAQLEKENSQLKADLKSREDSFSALAEEAKRSEEKAEKAIMKLDVLNRQYVAAAAEVLSLRDKKKTTSKKRSK
jgi:predicted nuclease with TOPRIM domain